MSIKDSKFSWWELVMKQDGQERSTSVLLKNVLKLPVVITDAVWMRYVICINKDTERISSRESTDRLVHLLQSLYVGLVNNSDKNLIFYDHHIRPDKKSAPGKKGIKLKAMIKNENCNEPIISVMLPEE